MVPVNDNDPRRIIANLQAFWAEVFATHNPSLEQVRKGVTQ